MDALLRVHHEEHRVRVTHGHFDLPPDGAFETVAARVGPSPGVHQPKPPPAPLHRGEVPIAGNAGPVIHDCPAAPHDPVEERGFANVGSADDRHRGALHAANAWFSASAKSYDNRTGAGVSWASWSNRRSSRNMPLSFTASAGRSARSRSPLPASARRQARPGSRPAVVTEGPKRSFSATNTSNRPPVAAASVSTTRGISRAIAVPVSTAMRRPLRLGNGPALAIRCSRYRTLPTPFSACSKSPYQSAGGSGRLALRYRSSEPCTQRWPRAASARSANRCTTSAAARHSASPGSRAASWLLKLVSPTGTTATVRT